MLALEAFAPILIVVVTGLVVLVCDLFWPRANRVHLGLVMTGMGLAAFAAWRVWPALPLSVPSATGSSLPQGIGYVQQPALLVADKFAVFVWLVLVLAAALTALASVRYGRAFGLDRGEYPTLLAFATAGMMILASANELVLIFLALETFSIALYVLTAFRRADRRAQEAGLKYFVLGSLAAALLLYGAALTFAALGTTNLDQIRLALQFPAAYSPLALAGFGLVVLGLSFKLALVPFHQWTPDVYTGASAPVTGFMSAATKAAAAAVLVRVLWSGFPALRADWLPLLAAVALLTMVVGNLLALAQSDMKRMMGASAVAHAGTLLVAVLAGPPAGTMAALFYVLVYAVTSLGVFAVLGVISLEAADASDDNGTALDASALDDLRGLAHRHPALAAALTILLASLAGLPPTAGFLAKWYVFQAAVGADLTWLAVIVVVTSVVAAFTYLRPVAYMYFASAEDEEGAHASVPVSGAVAVAVPALAVALAIVVGAPLALAARDAAIPAQPSATALPDGSAPAPNSGQGIMFTAPAFEKKPAEEP